MATRGTSIRKAFGLSLCALTLAGAAGAQSFDNFDSDPLGDFSFETEPLPDVGEVPSLAEGGDLGIGSDIGLRGTDGQSGVGMVTIPGTGTPVTSVSRPATAPGDRVLLRLLDKTLGRPTDIDMGVGETVVFGRLAIEAQACRFPAGDPASDAYARLAIYDQAGNDLFTGWMIASSPALSALEHPRYDVWVLRCTGA